MCNSHIKYSNDATTACSVFWQAMSGFTILTFLRLFVNIDPLFVHKQVVHVKDAISLPSLSLKTCQRVIISNISISANRVMQENCHFQTHFSR